jgi:hypothetical protein
MAEWLILGFIVMLVVPIPAIKRKIKQFLFATKPKPIDITFEIVKTEYG